MEDKEHTEKKRPKRMAVDYRVFISSIEDILRSHGLQHDSEGNSVTEKIFFDLLVYRAVCQSTQLQEQIGKHLTSLRANNFSCDADYALRFGNTDVKLNHYELIQNIDKDCCLDDNTWTRFISAFSKMKSTWDPIFPNDFFLERLTADTSLVQRAFDLILKKFKDIEVNIGGGVSKEAKSTTTNVSKRLEMDDVGDIFEFFLSCKQEKRANSRALGQYFTPNKVIQKIVSQMDLKPGQSVLDYACGSGGFLVEALRKQKNLTVYGSEISSSPYRLAVLNVFFASDFSMPDMERTIVKDDAFHFVPRLQNKVDFVLANPPFGVNVNTYNKTHRIIESSAYICTAGDKVAASSASKKMKTNKTLHWEKCGDILNPVEVNHRKPTTLMLRQERCEYSESEGLFLSLSIAALKDGGRAGIVFSFGILTGDQNTFYRRHLLSVCTVDTVYMVPRGVFKNTAVETCIVIFSKQKTGGNYLIPFRDFESDETFFSLFSNDVMQDSQCRLFSRPWNISAATLSAYPLPFELSKQKLPFISYRMRDVCEACIGEPLTDEPTSGPLYKAYCSGKDFDMTHRWNRRDRTCKIARCGMTRSTCVVIVDGPFFCKDSAFTVESKSPLVLKEYLWYWLWFHKDDVYDCSQGNDSNIVMDRFWNLELKVPTCVMKQKEIIDLLESFYHTDELKNYVLTMHFAGMDVDNINKKCNYIDILVKQKEAIKIMLQECEKHKLLKVFTCRLDLQKDGSALKEYHLSDLCDFGTGQTLDSKEIVTGPYPVIGQQLDIIGQHDHFNCPALAILCSVSGNNIYISRYDTPVWASNCLFIKVKDTMQEIVDGDFLFYCLRAHQEEFQERKIDGKEEAQNSLVDLRTFCVRLPPVDKQILCIKEIKQWNHQNIFLQGQLEDTQKLIQTFLQGNDNDSLRDTIEKSAHTFKKTVCKKRF